MSEFSDPPGNNLGGNGIAPHLLGGSVSQFLRANRYHKQR